MVSLYLDNISEFTRNTITIMARGVLRLLLVILALASVTTLSVDAQWHRHTRSIVLPRHEVKLNLANTILALRPEVAYEYAINHELSVGGRIGLSLDEDSEMADAFGRFQAMPYFRWNFYRGLDSNQGPNSAKGLFLETNLGMSIYNSYYEMASTSSSDYVDFQARHDKNSVALGLGLGLGYKWISPRGWVFETSALFGRNFFHPEDRMFYGGYGLSIGYHF